MRKDPVCGMDVAEDAPIRSSHNGETYVFCAQSCKESFDREPKKYVGGAATEVDDGDKKSKGILAYTPIFVIVLLSALAAAAKQVAYGEGWQGMLWMHDFMGVFLVVFSMVKLFNLTAFAKGFRKYDLLARVSRPYAFAYPFIELGLGLGFLSMWQPHIVYIATIIILLFGSLGVFNAMRQGKDLNCACMGQVLDVPLSAVTLSEDLGMAAMAAAMLFFG